MCGIVASVGASDAVPILIEGLAQLEYRGYDSAGLGVVTASGALKVHKRAGRVTDLADSLPKRMKGPTGIGHTRWATHGQPNDVNAHPHLDGAGQIAVVHNGIVENAADLRTELEAAGVRFVSDTDSEVFAHLIAAQELPLVDAVRAVLTRIEGAYGIAVLDSREPRRIVVARNGSPIVLGVGRDQMFAASDVAAIVRHTDQIVHLDDGEIAVLEPTSFRTLTLDARPTDRQPVTVEAGEVTTDLGGHDTFLHKEIHEQPVVIDQTLRGRLDRRFATAHLGGVDLTAREVLGIRRVTVLGCGSAYYSGMLGAGLVESLSRIPASAEVASEFRYRNPVIDPHTLYVAVSQSGETYDTLAAVQEITRKGGAVMGVVNTPGSSVARACGSGIHLHAGPEVSVASTKTFTATVVAFALLALQLGRVRDLSSADGARLIEGLASLPDLISEALLVESDAVAVGERIAGASSAFFIGRVGGYPVALEGAQKLKEISYVHAEAYPGAELKHGPLALIGPEVPTLVVLPDDSLLDKNLASVAEINARKGPVIAVTDVAEGRFDELGFEAVLRVPRAEPELAPVLLSIPMQLVAYHAAAALGRDIDRPRNLAKSVTVE